MSDSEAKRVLMSFVRGEIDPAELVSVGLSFNRAPGSAVLEVPAGVPVVEPSLEDLAAGVLARWTRSHGFCEWATAILMLSCVDLAALEDSAAGESVLQMIWNVSAREALTDADIALLRSI